MKDASVRKSRKKKEFYTRSIISCTNCKEIVTGKDNEKYERQLTVGRDVNAFWNIYEIFLTELKGRKKPNVFNRDYKPTTRGEEKSLSIRRDRSRNNRDSTTICI